MARVIIAAAASLLRKTPPLVFCSRATKPSDAATRPINTEKIPRLDWIIFPKTGPINAKHENIKIIDNIHRNAKGIASRIPLSETLFRKKNESTSPTIPQIR